jgi:hypothetical protein
MHEVRRDPAILSSDSSQESRQSLTVQNDLTGGDQLSEPLSDFKNSGGLSPLRRVDLLRQPPKGMLHPSAANFALPHQKETVGRVSLKRAPSHLKTPSGLLHFVEGSLFLFTAFLRFAGTHITIVPRLFVAPVRVFFPVRGRNPSPGLLVSKLFARSESHNRRCPKCWLPSQQLPLVKRRREPFFRTPKNQTF